jgi:sugar O-acyltransferase (sialic acid O-acetyltransferase NeuD family)
MTRKNDRFVIWGSGGTAAKLSDVVVLNGGRVIAIFDRNAEVKSVIDGVPIYHGEAGLKEWVAANPAILPCNALVGAASAPGAERIELFNLLSRYHFLTPSIFHPTAVVSPSAKVSQGCAVFTHAIVDAHASLGNSCILNDASRVGHDCVVGDGVFIAPGAMLLGGSRIGDHAMIGANAVVLPHVRVGANAKVGAGAVVLSDLPANVVAVGNPARIIGTATDGPSLQQWHGGAHAGS